MRLLRDGDCSLLLKRATVAGGESGWMAVGGSAATDGQTAESYIAREIARDDDLWVIEIEDPKQRFHIDGPVSE